MTTIIIIIALLLWLMGIIGSIAPVLPWPILGVAWLLIVELFTPTDFSTMMWIWIIVLMVISIGADYLFPIIGTKRYGGSKRGIRWSVLGLILGIFLFPPRGIIIWPLLGAFLGEWYYLESSHHALKAARGSFIGSVWSTIVKLIVSTLYFRWLLTVLW